MRDLVLGIDCSTTAAKVVAWDRAGKAVGAGRAALQEIRPRPGYSEQRAEGWWEATATAVVDLLRSPLVLVRADPRVRTVGRQLGSQWLPVARQVPVLCRSRSRTRSALPA